MTNAMYKAHNTVQFFDKAGNVISKGCNSITFINAGVTGMYINKIIPVPQGTSLTLSQAHPEVTDETDYSVSFEADTLNIKIFQDINNFANNGNACVVIITNLEKK